ncbi:amidohydrolase [Kribbella sp. NBC_00709]|uniref:amidohydrolase family protein n=1 Tax=Kribbella sp. NBC_00709 TaxID=2975972 RepID=UPI002E27EF94|nr:amidohydrolase family protein [Kribbella sp. NBC_00709]
MIVDAHTHVWPRWPYDPPVPDDTSRGSYHNLLHAMDSVGVDRALLINARITRSDDNNEYGAEAVTAYPDRFVHVVDLDGRWAPAYHIPGAADRLRVLVDRFRPAGVSRYLAPENDGWLRSTEGRAVFEVAAQEGLFVNFACAPSWQEDLREVAREFPTVTILVNHLAGVTLWGGGVEEALAMTLSAEELPNLLVKVSGFAYGTDRPWEYPNRQALDVVRALHDSWGSHRLVWGSDWPSVTAHLSYRQSLEIVREHAPFIDPAVLPLVLGGNLERILTQEAKA